MAASCLRRGMTEPVTFSLFARRMPPHCGFLVAAGLEDCLDLLERFQFDEADLPYRGDQVGLPDRDFEALAELRFDGEVREVREGRMAGGPSQTNRCSKLLVRMPPTIGDGRVLSELRLAPPQAIGMSCWSPSVMTFGSDRPFARLAASRQRRNYAQRIASIAGSSVAL